MQTTGRRYYHVVGAEWNPGEPLLPFSTLAEMGVPVEWRWDEDPDMLTADEVCVYETLAEAEDHLETFGGARILAVDVPDDLDGYWPMPWGGILQPRQTRNVEGFVAFTDGVPGQWITEVGR